MPNDRLRDALMSAALTPEDVAPRLGVDPKTVERWITTDRIPYPKHRHKLAVILRQTEAYLWPNAIPDDRATEINESEIIKTYPHRNAVPADLWDQLLNRAETSVDILVYVGMFLTEKPELPPTLRAKAKSGATIRMLFGERDSAAVIQRSIDEGIGSHTISAKIDHALAYFRQVADTDGIEIRTHETVLYNSIYRFDDQMIVNPHVYGKMAPHAPALHLRRLSAGTLFTTYAESFNAVWEAAKPHKF
jgi:hypothetical protein